MRIPVQLCDEHRYDTAGRRRLFRARLENFTAHHRRPYVFPTSPSLVPHSSISHLPSIIYYYINVINGRKKGSKFKCKKLFYSVRVQTKCFLIKNILLR